MTKKTSWKARAAEIFHISLSEAEAIKASDNKGQAPVAFMKIGAAKAIQDLLAEYGVEIEPKEQKEESKIVLLS